MYGDIIGLPEARRMQALQFALALNFAGNTNNLIASAEAIENYLSGPKKAKGGRNAADLPS